MISEEKLLDKSTRWSDEIESEYMRILWFGKLEDEEKLEVVGECRGYRKPSQFSRLLRSTPDKKL